MGQHLRSFRLRNRKILKTPLKQLLCFVKKGPSPPAPTPRRGRPVGVQVLRTAAAESCWARGHGPAWGATEDASPVGLDAAQLPGTHWQRREEGQGLFQAQDIVDALHESNDDRLPGHQVAEPVEELPVHDVGSLPAGQARVKGRN